MSYLQLRESIKSKPTHIGWFFSVVFILHVFVIVFQAGHKPAAAPVLPDWVKIKLIAHSDYAPKKTIKNILAEKTTDKIQQIKKELAEKKSGNETSERVKEDILNKNSKSLSKPDTYVAANSKPFSIQNPKPHYPVIARRRGMQGTVKLKVNVSEQGLVTAVILVHSSGHKILDNSAIESIRKWRFMPAVKGDEKVSSVVIVPFKFHLNME